MLAGNTKPHLAETKLFRKLFYTAGVLISNSREAQVFNDGLILLVPIVHVVSLWQLTEKPNGNEPSLIPPVLSPLWRVKMSAATKVFECSRRKIWFYLLNLIIQLHLHHRLCLNQNDVCICLRWEKKGHVPSWLVFIRNVEIQLPLAQLWYAVTLYCHLLSLYLLRFNILSYI